MQHEFRRTREDILYHRMIPVLKYNINYPFFTTTCSENAAHHVNKHYITDAKRKEAYCRNILYPQAVSSARYIPTNRPPFHSYEFLSDYTITLNSDCITSLYSDQYTYMGGAHGATVRTSDTWDFRTGRRLTLEHFSSPGSQFPEFLFHEIEKQIQEQLRSSPYIYFDDYAVLLRETFHPEQFYLKPDGLIIYYQQYHIAPYASGIPEFFIALP